MHLRLHAQKGGGRGRKGGRQWVGRGRASGIEGCSGEQRSTPVFDCLLSLPSQIVHFSARCLQIGCRAHVTQTTHERKGGGEREVGRDRARKRGAYICFARMYLSLFGTSAPCPETFCPTRCVCRMPPAAVYARH